MVDEVAIWRGSTMEHDDGTLVESLDDEGELVYQGKARIRPTGGTREASIGEGVIALRDADVLLPHDSPSVYKDDEVNVLSSDDPDLDDAWFRVTDTTAFSQRSSRSISVVQSQPSRKWPNLISSEEEED